MKRSDMITGPPNEGRRVAPGLTKKIYVFVFVPIYLEKKSDAMAGKTLRGPLAILRRLSFRQDRHLQLFWTWFIDNPRPESRK